MDDDRMYDVVLLGATGFTGGLTADYLSRHAPSDCRWAIAGRSRERLKAVRDRLVTIDPLLADLPLVVADVSDPGSLQALARSTRVLATTVGPYSSHGEPVVAACADAGTDYVDLAGEPEFVDRMYLRYHERARESGARLVHSCGFDSIPYDLGVLYTLQQLPGGVPVRVRGVVRTRAAFSGGTYHSALLGMSRMGATRAAARERRRREGRPPGRRVRGVTRAPHRDRRTGLWLVPLPTLDPQVVLRSAAALDGYGPDFEYSHYAGVRRLPVLLGGVAGVGALVVAAQVPPLRSRLLDRVQPGDGPPAERRAKAWFRVRFDAEAGGKQVVTEVSGGDPGYDETAKMLAESALCLAFDENPPAAGQLTPAVAMGERLLARLVDAGLTFQVLEQQPPGRVVRL